MNKIILAITSSQSSQSVLKSLPKTNSFLFFFCILLVLLWRSTVWAEFCCTRDVIPLPIKMPPEQESDCSGYIGAVILPTLREADIFSCPIKYGQVSYETREFLNWMVDELGSIAGAPFDPENQKAQREYLSEDYAWKGVLTLNRIDEQVEGYWERGYMPGERSKYPPVKPVALNYGPLKAVC